MSFAGGVFVVLLSFPIIFVISVVISFFTRFEYSFWDRVLDNCHYYYFFITHYSWDYMGIIFSLCFFS